MKVIILGEGRLGKLLRKYLEKKGCEVFGTRTENWKLGEEIKDLPKGFREAYVVGFLPPSAWKDRDDHGLKKLYKQVKVKGLYWTSSTGVYSREEGLCTESSIKIGESQTLVGKQEKWLKKADKEVSIVRCAGLIGEGSHPAQFLSRKVKSNVENAPVNLVWRSDAAKILGQLILKKKKAKVINACAPDHPSKISYYTLMMNKLNIPVTRFDLVGKSSRIVCGDKAIKKGFLKKYKSIYDLDF